MKYLTHQSRHQRIQHHHPPILLINLICHITMKRRMRPIYNPAYKLMIHRIKMNIINVPFIILIITNLVFPEPSITNGCVFCTCCIASRNAYSYLVIAKYFLSSIRYNRKKVCATFCISTAIIRH
jgi:hypothetical protein